MTVAEGMQIEHVDIERLRPDPANPRKIADAELEALTRSMREFGFVQPVIALRSDSTVVGGHQRLLAARKLGMTQVPVVYVDLTLEQARVLNLALNKISGSWDDELLAHMVADLSTVSDIDLSLSGFGEDGLAKLMKSLDHRERRDRPEAFDLDAALEAAQAGHGAKRGDLWALGEHRLLCGDAADPKAVPNLLDGKRAQLCVTDPPYNLAYTGGPPGKARRRRIKNDALPKEEWEAFCRAWGKNLLDHTDGAVYVCMSTREWPRVSLILEEAGGHWSDSLVWAKDRFTLGARDYQTQYEPICYGWREGVKRHWCGARDQGNVITIKRPSASELHPTTKPLELAELLIENSSRPGDLVFDPFLGSGTTLIAAERTGRTCYGMPREHVRPQHARGLQSCRQSDCPRAAERPGPPTVHEFEGRNARHLR